MRDDFSKATVDRLAKRAGYLCSNPHCRVPSVGAAQGHDGVVNIGIAAHITAAAAGGPRYDATLSHLAIVERHKVLEYLLNAAHPDNGGKAQFFESLSFTSENPELLASALHAVAQTGQVVELVESTHGEKYVVDGRVSSQTEKSRHRMVRTVWIIDQGAEAPRLVTAYPGRE